jgi:hypothetical protein
MTYGDQMSDAAEVSSDRADRSASPDAPGRPWRSWLLVIAIVTLPFFSLLTGSSTAIRDDVHALHLPLISHTWERILHGEAPFWGHWMFSGHNLLGAGQAAIFYPINAMLGVMSPVAGFRWWTLVHLWLAASGAFAWAWHLWRSRTGAVVAGIAYGLNGFAILHLVHMPFSMAAAWFPWLYLGLDVVRERWTLRRAGLVVGSLAMIAFSGHPQMLWLALVSSGVYAGAQLLRRGTGPWPAVRVAGATALGLGVAAVQLVPQYLFSRISARPSLSQSEAFAISAEPHHLLTTLVGNIMGGSTGVLGLSTPWGGTRYHHEVANYLGASVVLLALVGAVVHRRDRRVQALVLIAVVSVFAAVGDSTPVAGWLFEAVPLADRFRVWSRSLVLFDLAACGLAAAGVSALASASRIRAGRVVAAALGLAAMVVVLPMLTDLGGARVRGHDLTVTLGVALVALALTMAAAAVAASPPTWHRLRWGRLHGLAGPPHPAFAALVVAAVSLELVVFAAAAPWRAEGWSPARADAFFTADQPSFGAPFDAGGGVDRYVTNAFTSTFDFRGETIERDLQFVNGYDPLIPADYGRMTGANWWGGLDSDTLWREGWVPDVLRVTTMLAAAETPPTGSGWQRDGDVAGGAVVRWTRQPRLPEAFVAGAVEAAPLDAIAVRLGDDSFDGAGVVLLDDAAAATAGFTGRTEVGVAGTASGTFDELGHGSFTVDADRPAVLVVSTAWLPGWSAEVNGVAAPVARADGLVLAVPVPAGRSTVEFSFRPPGLRSGAALALASLAALLAASWFVAFRARRRRLLPTPSAGTASASPDAELGVGSAASD